MAGSRHIRQRAALVGIAVLAACGGDSSPVTPREQVLVVIGRAGELSGAPIANAIVTLQVLWPGQAGGEFGCTGRTLVGHWVVAPPRDGLFVRELRVSATAEPMCIIALSTRSGDSVWRDTTTLITRFSPATADVVPDTVRLDLRLAPRR